MPTRVAVIEEAPRSVSVLDVRKSPRFLDRTSIFFRKVSSFRTVTRKKSDDRVRDREPRERDRKHGAMFSQRARSVELGNKAFGMSQPVLGVASDHSATDVDDAPASDTTTAAGSPTSTAPRKPRAEPPHHPAQPKAASFDLPGPTLGDATPRVRPPSGLPAAPSLPAARTLDGLPASETLAWAVSAAAKPPSAAKPSDHTHTIASMSPQAAAVGGGLGYAGSRGSDETFHSAVEQTPGHSPIPPTVQVSDFDARAGASGPSPPSILVDQSLPSSSLSPRVKFNPSSNPRNPFLPLIEQAASPVSPQSPPSAVPKSAIPPSAIPPTTRIATSAAPHSSPIPSTLPPRLASLPPPMMARYATQGSVRLTPTISPRPTPMPILNLPMLPMPTPRTPMPAEVTQSPARLRSMPALPLRGPSEADEADHETAALDEMEDVDEMDEGDEGDEDMEAEGPSEATSEGSGSSPEMEVPTIGRRLRSPLPPSLSRSTGSPGLLPQIDTSPLHIGFRASPAADVERPATQFFTPSEPVPVDVLRTPVAAFRKAIADSTDYFTSKSPERGSPNPDAARTPRPDDFVAPRTVPMPNASPRPGLYHQGSKSMVDLLSISRKAEPEIPLSVDTRRSGVPEAPEREAAKQPVAGPSSGPHAEQQIAKSPTLRRQRSLPMYTTATDPPPYPDFLRPPVIQPREEEGREMLPAYTNSIYLVAIMPRKMEFSAPGFQAKDRKWKRALCILEGTSFRVYRVHSGVVEDWWERTVGVGDRTSVDPFAVGAAGTIRVSGLRGTGRLEPERPTKDDSSPSQAEVDATEGRASTSAAGAVCQVKSTTSRSKLHTLLHPSRGNKSGESSMASSRSRLSFDTPRENGTRGSGSSSPRRQSMDSPRSRLASPTSSPPSRIHRNNSSDTSPPTSSMQPSSSGVSRASSFNNTTPATSHFGSTTSCCLLEEDPDPKDLLRAYTLQHAESGLASDYIKRKNVIRVRMEGEQFLLQAKDVPGVIEWIEGIQAATNVALDLDERPMPKGPIFPRRRRRRARRADASSGAANTGVGSSSHAAAAAGAASSSRPSQAR